MILPIRSFFCLCFFLSESRKLFDPFLSMCGKTIEGSGSGERVDSLGEGAESSGPGDPGGFLEFQEGPRMRLGVLLSNGWVFCLFFLFMFFWLKVITNLFFLRDF